MGTRFYLVTNINSASSASHYELSTSVEKARKDVGSIVSVGEQSLTLPKAESGKEN